MGERLWSPSGHNWAAAAGVDYDDDDDGDDIDNYIS